MANADPEAPASDATARGLLGASSPVLLIGMVVVRVVILVVTIHVGNTRPIVDGDIRRFEEIATTHGTPYRGIDNRVHAATGDALRS